MSLLRQLLISVTLAIIVILAGVLVFSVSSARQYLDTQLQAQADSTATSLALTLSQSANRDPTVRELLISVLFDSGEFRVIEFLDPTGRILVRREQGDGASGPVFAPEWFSHLLPLQPHVAQRQVTNGWQQLGVVRLQANDAYARDTLWSSGSRMVLLTLGAGVLWGLFVIILMRWLRRALREDVAARVRALAKAGQHADLPAVRHPSIVELQEVSHVIASAHKQVQATASEREARIESLEFELHRDEVTGLANRKYFMNEFRRLLEQSDPQQAQGGHVMLFRQCDLESINRFAGRRLVDQWLRNTTQLVQQIIKDREGSERWLARLNGSDFAFAMPLVPGPTAVRVADAVGEFLQAQRIQMGQAGMCRWRLALTDYEPGEDLSTVLSRLDEALMRAESAGHENVEYLPGADLKTPLRSRGVSEKEWRKLLDDALAEGWLTLDAQPANPTAESHSRFTGMLALNEPGATEPMSGYLFLPPAVRLGLSAACDLRALELGITWLRSHAEELVLRISLASVLEESFSGEVGARLLAAPEQAARLIVELDSYGLVANRLQVVAFAVALRERGVRIGLRRFAEQPEALLYLHEVAPAYVQVSGNLLAAQKESTGARRLLEAVQETAHDIGTVVDLAAGARAS